MKKQNENFKIGEARLVFEKSAPPETLMSRQPDAPAESADAAQNLFTSIEEGSRRMADEKLGQSVDWDAVAENPESAADMVGDLSDSWDNLDKEWDRFCAVVGAIFKIPTKKIIEIAEAREPAKREPGAAAEDIQLTPEDLERDPNMTKEQKRAEHAAMKLAEHPTWQAQIEITSRKYNIPVSTLVTFIEMESSFNPNSRPGIDPETGKPESSATGLAQAMPSGIAHYKKSQYELFRQENTNLGLAAIADLTEPATAIDFMGWHIVQKIRGVNRIIDRSDSQQGFPDSYRLTTRSDVRYLYMSYNCGEFGYLVVRRYLDARENFGPDDPRTVAYHNQFDNKNTRFLLKIQNGKEGWERRSKYAERVAQVAVVYDLMNSNAPAFDSPPIAMSAAPSSGYGGRMHPIKHEMDFHGGVDYPAALGTPVLSVKAGTVDKIVKNDRVSGNYLAIRHASGISKYLHLSAFTDGLKVGDSVTAGMEIGKVGSTGRSTGPHLHFMWQGRGGITQNPEASITAAMQKHGATKTA
ncbi:M23 family metallopeptidase [Candidatus Peregrinibacteria bacterium]|nr:M23 family metallopeptidase [Candidatus Peregrinibacteria bacterium]